ncbi:quinate permease [Phyllosticta citriasiana]|uniref:Quinate permease n=1 Tax=Phyllosticta citriasiana TaxID=595635 RepID=A0ABR1L0D7_9PEZI
MAPTQTLQGITAQLRSETSETPDNIYKAIWQNKKLLLISAFASFGGLLYGYQQGVIGQAAVMHSFIEKFPDVTENSTKLGWLTSILQLGGWAGALSSGVFAQVFSRKYTMFWGALWVILGSYLSAGASNPGFLYSGRFFTGIGVGTLSAVGPLYNAELAPPELRGFIISMQHLNTNIGLMCAYWISYGTNYISGTGEGQSSMAWRTPMIVQGVPAVCLALGVWLMPFSPRFLVSQGKDAQAIKSISYLRNLSEDHPLVRSEFLEIKADAEFEHRVYQKRFPNMKEDSKWRREFVQYASLFKSRDAFKRVTLAGMVMFFQQWTGIDSILFYASTIFQSLGLTSSSSSMLATGVIGILNTITTVPAILYIDKLGRKPMMISGSVGMCICQVIVGVIIATCGQDWLAHKAAGWAAVVFVWIYVINYAASWGPGSWILIAEIFPLSIRAKGSSIGVSSNWMNNFIIALIAPRMLDSMGWGMYIFFACWAALGGVFIYFFMPETKGKTLEEMDQVFGSKTSVEDTEMLARAQEDVGLVQFVEDLNGTATPRKPIEDEKGGPVYSEHINV